jgi:hypothetical protein
MGLTAPPKKMKIVALALEPALAQPRRTKEVCENSPAWSLTDQLKFEYFTARDFCVQVAAFRTRMSQTETRESENLEMKKKFLVFGSFGAMFLSVMLLFAPAKASVTSHCTNCTGIDSNGVTVTSTCRVRPIDSCFCPLTGKIIQNNCLRIP